MNIVDLHCDLLLYLATDPNRTPLDAASRCSGPQLQAGNVKTQVLAIFDTDSSSFDSGLRQIEIFLKLPEKYPAYFSKESILPAFEGALSFCLENEPLDAVFQRLENILTRISPLYISLTWNGENRFGGGTGSYSGLKEDGKELLQFLSDRGIALDFSHASDLLAREILSYIDAHTLTLPLLASHSNFRAMHHHERNLPDDVAKEIIRRKGLIGLVFYNQFLKNPQSLAEQIAYGIELGGEKALAFGVDFFCMEDVSHLLPGGGFFDEMANSSCYPSVLENLRREMTFSEEQLSKIASQNAQNFICALSFHRLDLKHRKHPSKILFDDEE